MSTMQNIFKEIRYDIKVTNAKINDAACVKMYGEPIGFEKNKIIAVLPSIFRLKGQIEQAVKLLDKKSDVRSYYVKELQKLERVIQDTSILFPVNI